MAAMSQSTHPMRLLRILASAREPGQLCIHPGCFGAKAVIRWTAPKAGMVALGAFVSGQSMHGIPAYVEVLHNGRIAEADTLDGFAGRGEREPLVDLDGFRSIASDLQLRWPREIPLILSSPMRSQQIIYQ